MFKYKINTMRERESKKNGLEKEKMGIKETESGNMGSDGRERAVDSEIEEV